MTRIQACCPRAGEINYMGGPGSVYMNQFAEPVSSPLYSPSYFRLLICVSKREGDYGAWTSNAAPQRNTRNSREDDMAFEPFGGAQSKHQVCNS